MGTWVAGLAQPSARSLEIGIGSKILGNKKTTGWFS
jgi:hypothetical protein